MDRFANASMADKLKDRQGMISAGKQVKLLILAQGELYVGNKTFCTHERFL